jgi:uncharacterized protein (DUF4213/DUF364 family)
MSAARKGSNGKGSWALYDELLAGIPEKAAVRRCLVGQSWTMVESEGIGLAMTHTDDRSHWALRDPLAGRALIDLSAHVRSWNVCEACIGLAALNAHYNRRERVEALLGRELPGSRYEPVFAAMAQEVEGKKVAVIGRFPGLEDLAKLCRLSILERRPQPGDLPDFACEYVLPEQDYVFITGTTIINKTLPRLLQLCAGARVVLVGPSVPLTPAWFDWGVDVIAGSVDTEPERLWTNVSEGGMRDIWQAGAVTLQVRAHDLGRAKVA